MNLRIQQKPIILRIALWAVILLIVQIVFDSIKGVNPDRLVLFATVPMMFVWLMLIAYIGKLSLKTWEALVGFIFFLVGLKVCRILNLGLTANLFLTFSAVFLGYLVASILHSPSILLPVAIVAGLVDIWGVYFGTTFMVQHAHPQVVTAVSAAVPAGKAVTGPLLTIGFGDFVFLGLFLTCIERFRMNTRTTLVMLYILLTLALTFVLLTGISVPALAPMAVAVVLANINKFKLKREEWFAILYVMLFIGVVVALIFLTRFLRR